MPLRYGRYNKIGHILEKRRNGNKNSANGFMYRASWPPDYTKFKGHLPVKGTVHPTAMKKEVHSNILTQKSR